MKRTTTAFITRWQAAVKISLSRYLSSSDQRFDTEGGNNVTEKSRTENTSTKIVKTMISKTLFHNEKTSRQYHYGRFLFIVFVKFRGIRVNFTRMPLNTKVYTVNRYKPMNCMFDFRSDKVIQTS